MPAWSYPVCMHASVRASSQHRHASDDIGLHGSRRRRARQTHGRVRLAENGGGGLGETNRIRSMRWNGDSSLFAAVRYYRCVPQRTSGQSGKRKPRHRVVDSDHALASRARRCPMDATRRPASRPRHVRDGTTRRMRARHPTRNRVYTLATPRGIEIRIRTKHKQTFRARAPGPGAHQNRKANFLGRKMGGCLPGGRVRRCGSRLGGWPERGATLASGPAPSS